MKALWSWFNDRTGWGDWCGRMARSPVAGGACWCKVLPCTILFAFCVQAITGFFLWMYYSPSAQTAWESVYFLQNEVVGGWLSAGDPPLFGPRALGAADPRRRARASSPAAYRAPRELVFWATVGLGLCAWRPSSPATCSPGTRTATPRRRREPAFSPSCRGWATACCGWPSAGRARPWDTSRSRVSSPCTSACFPPLSSCSGHPRLSGPAGQYCRGRRRQRCAATGPPRPGAAPWRAWSCWPWSCCSACQHGLTPPEAGATLLSPADTDPANGYNAARPEWFLVGVYEFSHWFPGQWAIIPIFIVPGLLVCIVLAMPFLAKRTLGHVFNVVFTIAVLIALVGIELPFAGQRSRQPGASKGDCPGENAGFAGVRTCSPRRHSRQRCAHFAAQRSQDPRAAAVRAELRQLPRPCRRQRPDGGYQGREVFGAEPGRLRQPPRGSPACWTQSRSPARNTSATRSSARARWRAL